MKKIIIVIISAIMICAMSSCGEAEEKPAISSPESSPVTDAADTEDNSFGNTSTSETPASATPVPATPTPTPIPTPVPATPTPTPYPTPIPTLTPTPIPTSVPATPTPEPAPETCVWTITKSNTGYFQEKRTKTYQLTWEVGTVHTVVCKWELTDEHSYGLHDYNVDFDNRTIDIVMELFEGDAAYTELVIDQANRTCYPDGFYDPTVGS